MHRLRILTVALATLSFAAAPKPDHAQFPDQSDPRAAAFSLAIALKDGDAQLVSRLYAGRVYSERQALEDICRLQASMRHLNDAAIEHFGRSGTTLAMPEEPKFARLPITALMAAGEIKVDGTHADLDWRVTKDKVQLERRDGLWFVTRMPIPKPAAMELGPMLAGMSEVFDQMTRDIQSGKFDKAYQAETALSVAMQKKLETIKQQIAAE